MHRVDFEKLVAEGFEQLPAWVREKIKNVALLVEDEPSEDVRKKEGLGEHEILLGYYQGIPLSARGEMYGVGMTMPDTIALYQLPIEEAAEEEMSRLNLATADAVRKVVSETIWHEFAHHFGMDENEVGEREQKRYPHDGAISDSYY